MPPVIGRFQIRSVLGAGAFGTVYRAFDARLQREVALKVAHPGSLDDAKRAQRFQREARATAKLRHPNIVPVFDVGVDRGRHYIAATYIDGKTLSAIVADDRLDFKQTAHLVRALALALEHAHRHGIIHRDVKPDNVRVDARGEPHLLDFGIAHLGESGEKLTHDGAVLGTPSYMAPEQARGQTGKPLPASDQYSLGVVLFELLTGSKPFTGATATNLIAQILTREPEAPRQLNRAVPRDLETICLKAMAKAPEDRYPSCAALADDLRRWLDDEPIQARRLGLLERTGRWIRREPVLALSMLGAGIAVVAAAVVPLILSASLAAENRRAATATAKAEQQTASAVQQQGAAREQTENASAARRAAATAQQEALVQERIAGNAQKLADEEQKRADRAIENVEASKRDLPRFQFAADIQLAQYYLSENDFVESAKRLAPYGAGAKTDADRNLADFTWRYLRAAPNGHPARLPDRLANVPKSASDLSLHWSPDGKEFVALARMPDGLSVERRNMDGGQPLVRKLKGDFESADGKLVVEPVSATRSQIHRDGAKITVLQHKGSIHRAAFAPNGKSLATLHLNEKGVQLWTVGDDVKSETIWNVPDVFAIRFSPNSKTLAATTPKAIHLWDVETRKEIRTLSEKDETFAQVVVFDPTGTRLVGVRLNALTLWNLKTETRERAFEITCHLDPIFTSDGTLLGALGSEGRVAVWDAASGTARGVFPTAQHVGAIRAFVWSGDGRWLVTLSKTGAALLWDVPGKRLWRILTRPTEEGAAAVLAPDGRLVLALSDGTVRVWKPSQYEPPDILENFAQPVAAVAASNLSTPSPWLAVAQGAAVNRIDPRTGSALAPLNGPTASVVCLAADFKVNRLAAGCADGAVFVWDVATGKSAETFAVPRGDPVTALDWCGADAVLAVGRSDGALALHRAGASPVNCRGHKGAVLAVAVSAEHVVSAGADGSVRVWDRAGKEVALAHMGTEPACAVAFAPDGKTLAFAGEEGRIHLWDVGGHKERTVSKEGHRGTVHAMAFDPEGKTLATVGADGTLRLCDTVTAKELTALQAHTGGATCLAFTPDGSLLVTGGKDRSVHFWNAPAP
jgi:WD40 repeat protein/tRNA A-37 threonylcarbamoyl transferase component Bud32